jgi:hypothetical protein
VWRWQATSKPKRETDRQQTENNEINVLDYRIGANAEVADKIVELAIPGPQKTCYHHQKRKEYRRKNATKSEESLLVLHLSKPPTLIK